MLSPSRSPAVAPRHCATALALFVAACHGGGHRSEPATIDTALVREWNTVAVDASGLDHTPSNQGPPHVFGHHLGPCRASRAMAIVHVAMFEAVNAITGRYTSLLGLVPAASPASPGAALAQAARDTLVALFPSQQAIFDLRLEATLRDVPDGPLEDAGRALGSAAAQAVLALRATDGANHLEPVIGVDHVCSDDPGRWRMDPVSQNPTALGGHWGDVTPWLLQDASQFRCEPPPAISSPQYAIAYAEAYAFGGDGTTTPTVRNEEETFIGYFWAYDGTPSLCAPPRLYNQLVQQIAEQQGTTGADLLRLLALANVAMADTAIAAWDSKYHYDYWRPVTAIREADPGTGPSGAGDGNALTACDPDFMPLGAPPSNLNAVSFTPPFPTYPSGHGAFGGTMFQLLRRYYGTDAIPFTFVSDEWNGVTRDNHGNVRPYRPRHFASFSEAEEENGQSRIYLGIHWYFDKTAGIAQGNEVADWVFEHLYVAR
ncbi:MAG: vanadium-dependent haloperoxidase [Planctomycetes bacterium]|nr:vanadium-dependent haloperoxidase [Planctomycetota bacterium]